MYLILSCIPCYALVGPLSLQTSSPIFLVTCPVRRYGLCTTMNSEMTKIGKRVVSYIFCLNLNYKTENTFT